MNSFEVLMKLLTSGDLAKITAAYPAIQSDINQTCDDLINLAAGIKKLIRDIAPIAAAVEKL